MSDHVPDHHHGASAVAHGSSGTTPDAADMAAEEPIANPGLPAHQPRPTDVDEAAARRAERQVATCFGLSSLLVIAFIVCYFVVDENQTFLGFGAQNVALGSTLGGALLLIGVGAIHWAKKLMADEEIVEYRHPAASSDEDRSEILETLRVGAEESQIARRPLIRNSLLGALALLPLAGVVALRDLGPLPGNRLSHTVWRKGTRVVNDVTGAPIKPEDVQIGQLINAEAGSFFPQEIGGKTIEPLYEGTEALNEKAKSALIVVRMEPDAVTPAPGRENWGIDGILAYSKICTHVGCPISLYEQQTHEVLCPCHQSMFDLADNARVVFGPAARPLPQLPLMIDSEGYIVAQRDFDEPVGPSFWERGEA